MTDSKAASTLAAAAKSAAGWLMRDEEVTQ